MAEEETLDDVQTQYPRLSYKDYVAAKRLADKDRIYTSSVNALGSIGATLGVGTMIAGDKDVGSTLGAGALSGMAGYHAARLMNAPPAIRLVVAALMAPAGALAMHKVGPYRGQ